ncbi:MAG: alpha/beta hydrolase [Eubacterium sp.]|nr:alpha/beta hydrolase [Eubacterium sp.]
MLIDDYKINYKETGEGQEVVLLLQGWGTDLTVYDSVAATISSKCRVIQLDFPGFGGSDEPREPWAVDDYADFVIKFLGQLNIKKVTLWGHSYGGRVIIKLANRENLPFEINRIVLVDSAGILPKKTFKQKFKIRKYKILKKFINMKLVYKICPDLVDEWRNKQGSADYRNSTPMMRACMVKAVNEDLTHLLPGIKQDTLLIWGDLDTATPIADARLMEEKIPNAGLAVIPGTGHFCFLEQPRIFAGIMASYFGVK